MGRYFSKAAELFALIWVFRWYLITFSDSTIWSYSMMTLVLSLTNHYEIVARYLVGTF